MRALRRDRLGKLERTAKLDADDIAADPQRSLAFPSDADIVQAFSETGLVGSLYEEFEPRIEQVAMAEAVRKAFSSSENLLVEAGTGVGKSMAYLVPAALTARANNIASALQRRLIPCSISWFTMSCLHWKKRFGWPTLTGRL